MRGVHQRTRRIVTPKTASHDVDQTLSWRRKDFEPLLYVTVEGAEYMAAQTHSDLRQFGGNLNSTSRE